jgi:hypothetical protein
MEQSYNLLDNIEEIALELKGLFKKTETSNIKKAIDSLNKPDLTAKIEYLSGVLNCSFESAFYFTLCIFIFIEKDDCSFNSISSYLGSNPFSIRKHFKHFDSLLKKGILRFYSNGRNRRGVNSHLTIDSHFINCLFNENWQDYFIPKKVEIFSFLEEINQIKFRFNENLCGAMDLCLQIHELKEYYAELEIVKKIAAYELPELEEIIIYFLLPKNLMDYENLPCKFFFETFFPQTSSFYLEFKRLQKKQLSIFEKNLVEFEAEDFFRDDKLLVLTEEARGLFLEPQKDNDSLDFVPQRGKLIPFDSILQTELYFDDEFNSNYHQFKNVVIEENYFTLIEKFKSQKLSPAITSIFFGPPGTGKTESVYQLAKAVGRHVILVDIGSVKDKFVGESEKRLKEIFSSYRAALKHFIKAPILLFNEADALLSARVEASTSSDIMNNAMQNILLQELEDFKGILIATTNHLQNLDKAYERRFLYKLKFNKPSTEIRAEIWKNKINGISLDDAKCLANNFELSGGQINNVAKKVITDELLFSKTATIENLQNYCEQENGFSTKRVAIGF